MRSDITDSIDAVIQNAPGEWLAAVCSMLRTTPGEMPAEMVMQRLPVTNNSDLSFVMMELLQQSAGKMSWEALSWALETNFEGYRRWKCKQQTELLWAGPSPSSQIPARRIDQVLYDLIAAAKGEILLVTFAAAKIQLLTDALMKATKRGVSIRLVLEFEESSEGQLSYDALKAFPAELVATAEVYHWPLEKRERNSAGRPGKLHAKCAVIDDCALIASANLTDDAFNRNMELGVLFRQGDMPGIIKEHFRRLILDGIVVRTTS